MSEKPLVFLIHGMGVHKKGWSNDFVNKLTECAGTFQYFNGKVLGDLVDFQEVTYDNYFTKALENWNTNAAKILALSAPNQRELVEKALGWIEGCSVQQDNFTWTHVADVLLWRLAPYLKNPIKNHIAEQITGKIIERIHLSPGKSVRCSVISHSLGTSVAHETLEDLARGSWSSGTNGFDPSFFHFENLHMIANVSRILQTEHYPVYSGKVHPGPFGDANSYCCHYYTYRHELDPFTWVLPFLPSWSVNLFDDKQVSHIHQLNVHDMLHYLVHPRVHITILRSLLGYKVVNGAEELSALTQFKNINLPPDQIKIIQDKAKLAAEALGASPDIIDVLKGLALYFKLN